MIPTNLDEALLNLLRCCEHGAEGFERCATRVASPALRGALQSRSRHCRSVVEQLQSYLSATLVLLPRSRAVPAEDDHYDHYETQVLSAFRDVLDLAVTSPRGAALVRAITTHFERALKDYLRVTDLWQDERLAQAAQRHAVQSAQQLSRNNPLEAAM